MHGESVSTRSHVKKLILKSWILLKTIYICQYQEYCHNNKYFLQTWMLFLAGTNYRGTEQSKSDMKIIEVFQTGSQLYYTCTLKKRLQCRWSFHPHLLVGGYSKLTCSKCKTSCFTLTDHLGNGLILWQNGISIHFWSPVV